MSDNVKSTTTEELIRLQNIVKELRGPDGCPWDKKQTPQSMMPYLIEEAYEVVEALENEDADSLKTELGDLMLHIVMQGEMSDEVGGFTLRDSLVSINEKLIRRHPHVFSDEKNAQGRVDDATRNWERSKKAEGRKSWLDGVPKNLPGLLRAQRVQEKASQVGFDWDDVRPALDKFHEEIDELVEMWEEGNEDRAREEFGDVLFALVNVARLMKLDSETTMRMAIDKFDARFRALELEFERNEWDLEAASLEEMDKVWDRIKHNVEYRK